MTSKLKRLFIVTDISQSGMCGEEGRYPPVYVPIAKVASPLSLLPLPDSLPSIAFHGHKGGSQFPSQGRGGCVTTWQVPAFEGGEKGACRQNHRFHLVAARASCKHDAEDVMSTDAEFQVTLYFGVI